MASGHLNGEDNGTTAALPCTSGRHRSTAYADVLIDLLGLGSDDEKSIFPFGSNMKFDDKTICITTSIVFVQQLR